MRQTTITLALIFGVMTVCVANALNDNDLERISHQLRDTYSSRIFTIYADTEMQSDSGTAGVLASRQQLERKIGAAIQLDGRGYLVTLTSITNDASNISALPISGEPYHARILAAHQNCKISVLQINAPLSDATIELTRWRDIEPGQHVTVFCPNDDSALFHAGSVEEISEQDGTVTITAEDFPVTSGAPVFAMDGSVLGMVAYRVCAPNERSSSHQTYVVIPMEYASIIARSIIHNATDNAGWLGVKLPIRHDHEGEGVPVVDVIDDSPAQEAGINPDDIILGIGDTSVSTTHDVLNIISGLSAGETVTLSVRSGDAVRDVTVRLVIPPGR